MKRLRRPVGRFCFFSVMLSLVLSVPALAEPTRTLVSGVLYRADGTPASGTLLISWPTFTTADQQPVAAGKLTIGIGENGAVEAALVPNEGAAPNGTFYSVVLHLDDGTTSTEYWSVPAAASATIAAVRSMVVNPRVPQLEAVGESRR